MKRVGAVTLGDISGPLLMLRVECGKCGRAGRYQVSKLIEAHGADFPLPELLEHLSRDCPKRADASVAQLDRCGAMMPDLPALAQTAGE